MLPMTYTNISILAVAAAILYSAYRHIISERHPYPPGPKGYPLLGNIFDDFGQYRWMAFRDLSVKHGESINDCVRVPILFVISLYLTGSDVIHLNMAGKHLVIVNTRVAAKELFDKRSAIYSSR
jgi:hypothetical protein